MQRKVQIITAVLLTFLILLTMFPFSALAGETDSYSVGAKSGTTGDCTWSLDDNGVLTISDNGEMRDYESSCGPWGKNITTVIIENGVTHIGERAFFECTNLTDVVFRGSVSSIGMRAFYSCTGLQEITIPDGATSIDNGAFYDCANLSSINIPDSVTSIGVGAFYNTAWLGNQPDGVIYAGKVAYSYKGLISGQIFIKGGTKGIADRFIFTKGGKELTSITIPDSVTTIGERAFYGNTNLTIITNLDNVTSVGQHAFYNTAWYNNHSDGLVYAGKAAYCYKGNKDMPENTSVTIKDGTKEITEKAFCKCFNLASVTIPDSVTNIGANAFTDCKTLPSVSLPDSLNRIEYGTFSGCAELKAISIPENVTKVEKNAFKDCDNLQDVYYGGSEEDWGKIKKIKEGNEILNNVRIHYNCYSKMHKIDSDRSDNRSFTFNDREEVEDLVFSKSSNEYNPRLAHFLACMSRSAYTPDLVKSNYKILGFNDCNQYHYEDDGYAGYNIGIKHIDDNKTLVLITIQGTKDWNDWLTDFNLTLNNSDLHSDVGIHAGFEKCENELFDELKSYFGNSIPKQNTTYIINGHSLGGAVGNLLALRLYNEGVSNKDVYDYNFACPLVGAGSENISTWNNEGVHNNIISINNWFDLVPSKPTQDNYSDIDRMSHYKKGWYEFKRFGVSYWFDNSFQFWWNAHDMSAYLDYLEKLYDESHFRDTEHIVSTVSVHCPVDVEIYDSYGNPIAGTVNNEPRYYDNENYGKVAVFVSGDIKTFYFMSDEEYDIRLHGTDAGVMDYIVSSENLTGGKTISQKTFNSVQLIDGKEMRSGITNDIGTADTQIFIVDENNNKTQEILTDGMEVNPIFVSESKLNLKPDDTVTLTAESEDDYRWFSTDESVATVENGVVTVRSFGKANIIAETVNGARAICKVIVPANCGDTDLDGKITISDVTEIQKYLAEFVQFTDEQLALADTDGDGKVDISDATHLQKYLAEFDGIVLGKQS